MKSLLCCLWRKQRRFISGKSGIRSPALKSTCYKAGDMVLLSHSLRPSRFDSSGTFSKHRYCYGMQDSNERNRKISDLELQHEILEITHDSTFRILLPFNVFCLSYYFGLSAVVHREYPPPILPLSPKNAPVR